jgi:hypothetical protein
MATVIMTGFPFALRAAEDRIVADGQGLGGGEHDGRQVLAAEPGGLVHAVAAVVMARG